VTDFQERVRGYSSSGRLGVTAAKVPPPPSPRVFRGKIHRGISPPEARALQKMSTETTPLSPETSKRRKVTTHRLAEMKARGEKIAMLTAYDFSFARILDSAGIDVVLVGDSAANVVHGFETTVPITLDQMISHASSVVRGIQRALVVIDMPFGSYQGNSTRALESAIRIMKESGAHAVKMEGGEFIIESVKRIVSAGIPVMGHLGLTPQSIYKFGTYVVRATSEDEAEQLVRDARLLQDAGCFAIVLEKIPAQLAERVSKLLAIPTIGIGAGVGVDGQVLVMHDMLGINQEFAPRFLRHYARLHDVVKAAFESYIADVKSASFPTKDESY
jgi:3-methyl-2-oxobutanoate hydroxymethyltransferase